MRALGADGQAMTVQEVLDWLQVSPALAMLGQATLGDAGPGPDTHLLQRTLGCTVTMLLCGDTVLYDSEADAETRARQQAQRWVPGSRAQSCPGGGASSPHCLNSEPLQLQCSSQPAAG